MNETLPLRIEPLHATAVLPYGWMLGKPVESAPAGTAFASPASDFWQEHVFDTGTGGEPEILWVDYRSAEPVIARLEVHDLTEQAVVPLTAAIVQVVAASTAPGTPDLGTLRAFLVPQGQGICMKPGTWHATRTAGAEARCLMLTRRSTTRDLAAHLNDGAPIAESRLADVPPLRLTR
ncbi:ureidoglycolate lyase [Bordetella genomosp. 5]|uniref:Ureidoglycolate hydrolase n=1 Tax=Bordetella genomosp. 5 TaxID=1395608 RepID=A0A261TBV4_9BORD|nr:ureidoglycolate lyase [Bordetella genomosp. 5]OZI46895.1 ureidoglycolate hydrolase [Bordetella genomosp. 5]